MVTLTSTFLHAHAQPSQESLSHPAHSHPLATILSHPNPSLQLFLPAHTPPHKPSPPARHWFINSGTGVAEPPGLEESSRKSISSSDLHRMSAGMVWPYRRTVFEQDDHVCTVAIGQCCMPTGCMRTWYRRDWVLPWRSVYVCCAECLCALSLFVVLGGCARERDRYGFSGADLRRGELGVRF